MKRYDKVTPDGTRDLLFEECVCRETIRARLASGFQMRGYRQVRTPALEFYDVFGCSEGYFPQANIYKLTDTRGRLLVLRPDCTIPIARLTATRLAGMPLPLRLYYSETVYRVAQDMRGKRNEIFQTGVELIGANCLRGDMEVVELAAEGLAEIAGAGYRIELCHIGYFKALIDSLQADDLTKEQIRQQIEQKNYPALSDLLEQFQGDAAAALKYLPRLFGGEEVFETAYRLFDQNGAAESLDYLKTIYRYLQQLGLEDRVIIDLGLVNQADYYTGLIFRGYCAGIGEPVLSGGRYDNLMSEFGEPLCATGFAFNVDLAAQAQEPRPTSPPDILVFADDDHLVEAINYIKTLAQNGLTAENCLSDEFDAAKAYANSCGIAQIHVVDDEIEVIHLKGGARG